MVVDFQNEAEKLFPEMVQRRRDFHQFPELGFHETRTSGLVANTLTDLGLEVRRGVGLTGVVGLLEGDTDGPTVLLRFDMDGLPIQEESEVAYRSRNPGVMHACGHDGHTTMGLALAKIFTRHKGQLTGRIKFAFQPAEEGLGGAFAMIADGVLEDPPPDIALAMHLWAEIPYGQVRVTDGLCMAASSTFTLTVSGTGGHGAAPHKSHDPILAAAHIITALQSIVSRNIDPLESVVVTIGQVSAGTTYNVIPERVTLKGTVRSFNTDLHRLIYRRILEMAKNMSTAFGCTAMMETISIVPAVSNALGPTQQVRAAAGVVLGPENVIGGRDMASEDMGFFLDEIPGCYFFVGARNEALGFHYTHHHPRFDFDERAMINGVAVMGEAAARYLMPRAPAVKGAGNE